MLNVGRGPEVHQGAAVQIRRRRAGGPPDDSVFGDFFDMKDLEVETRTEGGEFAIDQDGVQALELVNLGLLREGPSGRSNRPYHSCHKWQTSGAGTT